MRQIVARAVLGALLLNAALGSSSALANIEGDLNTVLKFGPRVAGSEANERARTYFEQQFRALGYQTRRDVFTYARFDDLGSDVRLGSERLKGRALQGTVGGEVTGEVVRVPNVGTSEDFASVNVRGKVAVVKRGQIPFAQKARNALAAGALGLIVENNENGELRGTLGDRVELPVLGVTPAVGGSLREGQRVTLAVRVREGDVQGVNVVAFKSGVSEPAILFGGHMDSVPDSPGANDNLSGTAAVLEIARRAVNTPLGARSYFVLFDGEEDGLRGSRAFVKDHPKVVQGLRAMFNFDMVGVDVTPLAVGGHASLVDAARKATPALQSFPDSGGSDHAPFSQAGVPALFFHRGIDVNYHQSTDTLVDPALVRETAEVALKTADVVLAAVAAAR